MRIDLFAAAREAVGTPFVTLEPPLPDAVAALRARLHDDFPALRPLLPRCAVAVNHEYAAADCPLTAGDEIAVLPPVSGG